MMRVMERTARRAELPLCYSQGFNPRVKFSLPCPRPVAVTALDDMLVLSLEAPIESDQLLARLNEKALKDMRFFDAQVMEGTNSPHPVRTHYELNVPEDKARKLRERLSDLAREESWNIRRKVSKKRAKLQVSRTIDIRPMVEQIDLVDKTLRITLVPKGDLWARPAEVLYLVDLDGQVDLGDVVRTEVEYVT